MPGLVVRRAPRPVSSQVPMPSLRRQPTVHLFSDSLFHCLERKSMSTSIFRLEARTSVLMLLAFALLAYSSDIWAQSTSFSEACERVDTFFRNFETILKVISVTVVTIAVVFAGYQIAFAHKRLSDVAPILIGGLLIGGAGTIASWFVGDWGATDCTAMLLSTATRSA
ncbi:MAG: TrbC/VirB2 family protein [Burkholderiaceae bacterium]